MAVRSPSKRRSYQTDEATQGYMCNPTVCGWHNGVSGRHCLCGVALATLDDEPCFWCRLDAAPAPTQTQLRQLMAHLEVDRRDARRPGSNGPQMVGERG